MKYTRRSLLFYLLFSFAPVWIGCLVLALGGLRMQALMLPLFAIFMFFPAIGSILTRLVCREGFRDMRLRPRFRGNWGVYVCVWLLPALLTLAGGGLYFLFKPDMLDRSFTMLTAMGVAREQLVTVIVLQTAQAMLLSPVANLIPCLGEELGWRGYLQPKLIARFGRVGGVLLTGAIWGVWHAPMIALGHNYGTDYAGYPWLGILLMTLFCVFFGAFLGWSAERTQSAIPAAVGHAMLNGFASFALLFCRPDYDPVVGPMLMGVLSGIPVLLAGAFFLVQIKRMGTPQQDAPA